MFNVPGSVKTLRAYYKNRIVPVDPKYFTRELSGESDRAIVILLSALLDDALMLNIGNHLSFSPTDSQFDYVFRFEGPIGTFSARIEIAYLFGFINAVTRGQLDDIREMRNACAHTKHQIDFGVPELANVAKRIFYPTGVATPPSDSRADLRTAFIGEFLVLLFTISKGSREAALAEILPNSDLSLVHVERPPSPDTPPQP